VTVLYLATASTAQVRGRMGAGELGQMVTPGEGKRPVLGARWALDNGCFSSRWTPARWVATLDRHAHVPGCLFAVVPDVVADAEATDRLWDRWWPVPGLRGYPLAYVAQNGCRSIPAGASALFLGGDDRFKEGPEGRRVAIEARARGLWLHMGRVNSLRRLRYAASIGCHSVDGTFLAFGPDLNLRRLQRYLRWAAEPTLFQEVPA